MIEHSDNQVVVPQTIGENSSIITDASCSVGISPCFYCSRLRKDKDACCTVCKPLRMFQLGFPYDGERYPSDEEVAACHAAIYGNCGTGSNAIFNRRKFVV